MTVSHAHARNACAHEQSTNIESGAVQWHKQLAERANFATNLSQSRPFATNAMTPNTLSLEQNKTKKINLGIRFLKGALSR